MLNMGYIPYFLDTRGSLIRDVKHIFSDRVHMITIECTCGEIYKKVIFKNEDGQMKCPCCENIIRYKCRTPPEISKLPP